MVTRTVSYWEENHKDVPFLLHQGDMLSIQFVTHFIVYFRLLHHRVTSIPFSSAWFLDYSWKGSHSMQPVPQWGVTPCSLEVQCLCKLFGSQHQGFVFSSLSDEFFQSYVYVSTNTWIFIFLFFGLLKTLFIIVCEVVHAKDNFTELILSCCLNISSGTQTQVAGLTQKSSLPNDQSLQPLSSVF